MGTTANQKKLFFNMRKAKSKNLGAGRGRPGARDQASVSPNGMA